MAYGKDITLKIKSLNFPLGKYIVLGGASLAVRGIRETRDLDILITTELFEELSHKGWAYDAVFEQKWNRKKLMRDDIEVYKDLYFEHLQKFIDAEEIINKADIIDGVPFQPLDHLLMGKIDTLREKDVKDIQLIKEYLKKQTGSNFI